MQHRAVGGMGLEHPPSGPDELRRLHQRRHAPPPSQSQPRYTVGIWLYAPGPTRTWKFMMKMVEVRLHTTRWSGFMGCSITLLIATSALPACCGGLQAHAMPTHT